MCAAAIDTLHILVEEPSMEEALQFILPKMLGSHINIEIRRFQCKDDLLKKLPQRLSGYANFLLDTAKVLVIVDRDDDDYYQLKQSLEDMARQAGLGTRQYPVQGQFKVINRIAIEELESWFFGDWGAVCAAYPKLDKNIANKAAYRDPDAIKGGTWEAMERELQKKGYFKQGLRKLELARKVACHMNPMHNKSKSFCCLRDALRQI